MLSFFTNGNLAVGFVMRYDKGPDKGKNSPIALHVITLNKNGEFLSKNELPTTDWSSNQIIAGSGDTLLVRTNTNLGLYSSKNKLLAKRELQDRFASVQALPNHTAFVIESTQRDPHQYIAEAIDPHTLETTNTCRCTTCFFRDVSDQNILLDFHQRLPDIPPSDWIGIAKFCGPLQFEYKWRFDTETSYQAALIDDNHFVLAGGGSSIEYFDRRVRQWTDSFKKEHSNVHEQIAVDEEGDRFAVLVQKWVGGSDFLDINAHVKRERIIVYDSATGNRVAQVPVEHLPSDVLDFQLSPDGKLLAILSDGDLELYPIDTH